MLRLMLMRGIDIRPRPYDAVCGCSSGGEHCRIVACILARGVRVSCRAEQEGGMCERGTSQSDGVTRKLTAIELSNAKGTIL